ncbi:type II secretion system protein GspD [Arcobacter arenosus]|uniref:type II secretion system protein GspD n=1 Tax=Arcobacter arenosus TaxID=2576037 RepID=UPI003BABBD77
MKLLFSLFLLITNLLSGELINVNFKGLKLKELIDVTSRSINKSILVTDSIEGEVDFISNEPIEKSKLLSILKFSLESNGYKLIESDNILRVVKSDFKVLTPIRKKVVHKQNKIISKNITKNIKKDSRTEVVFLTNIEARNLEKILKELTAKREEEITIAIDEEFNSIIIDGSSDEVKNLKTLISKLDIEKKQVYIKANIIELNNNLLQDVGLRFGILGGKAFSGGLYTFASNLNLGEAIAIDTSSLNIQIPNVSSSIALGASLNLLNKTYALDIISQPSILCINNKQSSIYVGETISIQTGSTTTDGGTTKTNFEREDVGLTLKVKPRVSKENKVLIQIDTILEGIKNENYTNSNPNTSKKELRTTAVVNNGESVILGGLIENKNQKSVEKIPIAGDIPLIGELFKNRLNDVQNKSLVVIITPYVVPINKDLTYIREELSKLKSLEDEFLEKVLLILNAKARAKKGLNSTSEVSENQLTNEERHKLRLKKYFHIN